MRQDDGLMDSGRVTLYHVSSSENRAVPGLWSLTEIADLPYQVRAVGYSHAYAARSAHMRIDRTIRIPWDLTIVSRLGTETSIALIDNRYYRLTLIVATKDKCQIPVLDLDLTDDDAAIRRKLPPS